MANEERERLANELEELRKEEYLINMADFLSARDKGRLEQIRKRINAIHKEYEEGRD